MEDCIFCKIIKQEIPAIVEYEDTDIIAFEDTSPSAEHHILIVPKEHIKGLRELNQAQPGVLDKVYRVVDRLIEDKKLSDKAYRVVVNGGKAQTVQHLHFHLLGGKWKKLV